MSPPFVVGGGAGEGHRVLADGRWGLQERCRDLAFVRSTGDLKTFSAANMCFSAADALEDDSCLHSVSVDAGGTVIRNHDPRASFPRSIYNMILSLRGKQGGRVQRPEPRERDGESVHSTTLWGPGNPNA